jgi:hypothetical protein
LIHLQDFARDDAVEGGLLFETLQGDIGHAELRPDGVSPRSSR